MAGDRTTVELLDVAVVLDGCVGDDEVVMVVAEAQVCMTGVSASSGSCRGMPYSAAESYTNCLGAEAYVVQMWPFLGCPHLLHRYGVRDRLPADVLLSGDDILLAGGESAIELCC
jgi:hypothetical protein